VIESGLAALVDLDAIMIQRLSTYYGSDNAQPFLPSHPKNSQQSLFMM
jgi:hypothetical protein